MNVLVACEYSGRVREAFRKRGHNVWSCDLLPAEDNSPYHIQGDVLRVIKDVCEWDLMIAHPPCTYLCNSGVRWLYTGEYICENPVRNESRWAGMNQAAWFFSKLWTANIPKICVENPIMHKYGRESAGILGISPQIIQPWMFGHGETKATCLWLKGLPNLTPTNIVAGREQRVHKMAPGPDRWKERSRTYQGIADAMAEQWG